MSIQSLKWDRDKPKFRCFQASEYFSKMTIYNKVNDYLKLKRETPLTQLQMDTVAFLINSRNASEKDSKIDRISKLKLLFNTPKRNTICFQLQLPLVTFHVVTFHVNSIKNF